MGLEFLMLLALVLGASTVGAYPWKWDGFVEAGEQPCGSHPAVGHKNHLRPGPLKDWRYVALLLNIGKPWLACCIFSNASTPTACPCAVLRPALTRSSGSSMQAGMPRMPSWVGAPPGPRQAALDSAHTSACRISFTVLSGNGGGYCPGESVSFRVSAQRAAGRQCRSA